MAVTSIDEAKRFLDLHPWATTDVDNPVELLRNVVNDFEKDLIEKTAELTEGEDAPDDPADEEPVGITERLEKLVMFVRGLRNDMKICESEYQVAFSLAKVA